MAGENNGKKRRGPRAYLDDYVPGVNGEYVYTGKVFIYTGEKPWKKAIKELWLYSLAGFLSVLICGLLPVTGLNNTFYIIIPWLASFAGGGSVLWAMIRLTNSGPGVKEYVYKDTVNALPLRSAFSAVCGGVAAILQAARLVATAAFTGAVYDIIFLLLMSWGCVCFTTVRKKAKEMSFE